MFPKYFQNVSLHFFVPLLAPLLTPLSKGAKLRKYRMFAPFGAQKPHTKKIAPTVISFWKGVVLFSSLRPW